MLRARRAAAGSRLTPEPRGWIDAAGTSIHLIAHYADQADSNSRWLESLASYLFSPRVMQISLLKLAAVAIGLAALVGRAAVAPVVYSLVGPTAAAPGTTVEVQVAVLNRSTEPMHAVIPATLSAFVSAGGERSSVTRQTRGEPPTENLSLAPGAFVLRTFSLVVPFRIQPGLAALDVQLPGGSLVRTALDITSAPVAARASGLPKSRRLMSNVVSVQPAAEALRRIFADRVAPHEANYFVYGPDDPVAKFQFSFKYKLLDFRELGAQRMVRTVHFAFTQRSLWDLNGESSPFYDTSYMPELMYQSLAPMSTQSEGRLNWLGFQAAFKHESNGRERAQSRSLNIVYARTVIAFGSLEGWHLLAIPEVFGYVSSLDENPDIADYRGYGRLSLALGRNDGPSLTALLWVGKDFDHFSSQFDLTLPVRTRYLNFETYFLLQYFNGYGESLLAYWTRSETVRAGISLVR